MLHLPFHRGVRHTSLLERIQVPPHWLCLHMCPLAISLVVGLHPLLRLVVGFGNIVLPPPHDAPPRIRFKAEIATLRTYPHLE